MVNYVIRVKTANVVNAGTDAKVFITLIGDGSSKEFLLDSPANDFEQNSEREYIVQSWAVGDLKFIRIRHDNSNSNPGWYLNYIIVSELESGKRWSFPYYRWLAKDEDEGSIDVMLNVKQQNNTTFYKVRVKTGNVKGAGTDANVTIFLIGTNGVSEKFFLNSDNNDFERNSDREYLVQSFGSAGEMMHVLIGHDNSGSGPGWFLSSVTVTEVASGKNWFFPCNRWLAKDEDDGAISRMLNKQ